MSHTAVDRRRPAVTLVSRSFSPLPPPVHLRPGSINNTYVYTRASCGSRFTPRVSAPYIHRDSVGGEGKKYIYNMSTKKRNKEKNHCEHG